MTSVRNQGQQLTFGFFMLLCSPTYSNVGFLLMQCFMHQTLEIFLHDKGVDTSKVFGGFLPRYDTHS